MSYYPCSTSASTSSDWSHHTLILPTVSIGNVPQLVCDLLLSTFTHHRIGIIYDEAVIPVVGNDTTATTTRPAVGKLSVAVEVYEIPSHKLVVVQQRSPTIKSLDYVYSSRLHTWMRESRFARVILVSSQSSHIQKDMQLQAGNPFHYFASGPSSSSWLTSVHNYAHHIGLGQIIPVPVTTTTGTTSTSSSTSIGTGSRSAVPSTTSITSSPISSSDDLEQQAWLPSSGITRCLATVNTRATESNRVPLVGLVMSTSDSDNARDAMLMVELVWATIQNTTQAAPDSSQVEWRTPLAWEYVFGDAPSETLYL